MFIIRMPQTRFSDYLCDYLADVLYSKDLVWNIFEGIKPMGIQQGVFFKYLLNIYATF